MNTRRFLIAGLAAGMLCVAGCKRDVPGVRPETQGIPTNDSLWQEVAKVAGELDSLLGGSGRHRQFVFGIVSGGDTVVWSGDLPAKAGNP